MTHPDERRIHPHLVETRGGGIATLRIDRTDALGALSRSILERLHAYLDDLAADDTIRVLLITGTGRGFIAGADIGEYDGATDAEFTDYQHLGRATFAALAALPQVTIAAVNGYALGGGFELVLCCDLVVAAEKARFGLPEIKLGLLPGGGGTQRLTRAAGAAFAKELVLTGRFATAAELAARGLVARVCPADSLTAEATMLAETIAGNAPLAVRAAARLIDDGQHVPLDAALSMEQDTLIQLYTTRDAKEGITAFIGKREPTFTGR